MPAVFVDPVSLPRLQPTSGPRLRDVRLVSSAPSGFEGEGFPVRRAFANLPLELLDPFVHMDQMGAVEYAPLEPRGTPWHPHRGFETVTYILDGAFQHQDSAGGGGLISDGATQWMTAGSGILHIETPPEELVLSGGLFHGVQLWVNLPSALKWIPPAYQSLEPDAVGLVASSDGASLLRVIAGLVGGVAGPGSTRTPVNLVHASVPADSRLSVPWPDGFNALVYVLDGACEAGPPQAPAVTGDLIVFSGVGDLVVRTGSSAVELLFLGGSPLREPVAKHGPFVMNTAAELQQAFDDLRSGRLGSVPRDGLQPFRGPKPV